MLEQAEESKLLKASRAIVTMYSNPGSLEETLQGISRVVSSLLEAKLVSILLLDEEEESLYIKAHYLGSEGYIKKPPLEVAGSLVGEVVKTHSPIFIPDIAREDRLVYKALLQEEGLVTLLSVPLSMKGAVIGVMNVYWSFTKVLSQEELELANLSALHSAMAIENARLHGQVVQAQKEIADKERLVSLGELSAGLAHEIRNPLNVINMLLYAIQRQAPEFCRLCQVSDDISVLNNEVKRINLLIEQFLDFARPSGLQRAPHDIKEILEEVLILTAYEAKSRGVTLVRIYSKEPAVLVVDGNKLKQVFLNLVLNGLQAIDGAGEVSCGVRWSKAFLRVDIQDTGSGVDPKEIPRLFIPFYTTKEKGIGLGLPLSARIIEEHGGKISLEPSPSGKGMTATVLLPRQGLEPGW